MSTFLEWLLHSSSGFGLIAGANMAFGVENMAKGKVVVGIGLVVLGILGVFGMADLYSRGL